MPSRTWAQVWLFNAIAEKHFAFHLLRSRFAGNFASVYSGIGGKIIANLENPGPRLYRSGLLN